MLYDTRGPWPWSKWARYKRANSVWFHFCEEPRIGRFIKGGEGNWMVPVSICDDEKLGNHGGGDTIL